MFLDAFKSGIKKLNKTIKGILRLRLVILELFFQMIYIIIVLFIFSVNIIP